MDVNVLFLLPVFAFFFFPLLVEAAAAAVEEVAFFLLDDDDGLFNVFVARCRVFTLRTQ